MGDKEIKGLHFYPEENEINENEIKRIKIGLNDLKQDLENGAYYFDMPSPLP